MNWKELRNMCIKGSEEYLDYVRLRNKSRKEIGVERITQIGLTYELWLTESIRDPDWIFLNIDGLDCRSINDYGIEEYKDEPKTHTYILSIKPSDTCLQNHPSVFRDGKCANIKIVSDLSFLIERVLNYYQSKDDFFVLRYPMAVPITDEIKVDSSLATNEQIEAIKASIKNSFTYIGGIPGSGKTKIVMANSVKHYLIDKRNVLIVAPTNVAIENALRDIITALDSDVYFDRRCVRRCGVASYRFRSDFPESCKVVSDRAVVKLKQSLDKKIADLQECSKHCQALKYKIDICKDNIQKGNDRISQLKHPTSIFQSIGQLNKSKQIDKLNRTLDEDKQELARYETQLSEIREQENKTQETINDIQLRLKNIEKTDDTSRVKIWGCTLDWYIANIQQISGYGIQHIYLDEAGYSSLVKALPLLELNVPVTFLGDHMQLGPVCEMDNIQMNSIQSKDACVWALSSLYLYDALDCSVEHNKAHLIKLYDDYNNGHPFSCESIPKAQKLFLCSTFRYGSNLTKILSDCVYGIELTSYASENTAITYVDVIDSELRNSSPIEAKKCVEIVEKQHIDDYVILTPYKNQVEMIKKMLSSKNNKYKVQTIHSSQSQEWDTVILSTVKTSGPMVKDVRVYNTAISRAKKKVIIVCNRVDWISNASNTLIGQLVQ